jgi:hypothetical protein
VALAPKPSINAAAIANDEFENRIAYPFQIIELENQLDAGAIGSDRLVAPAEADALNRVASLHQWPRQTPSGPEPLKQREPGSQSPS